MWENNCWVIFLNIVSLILQFESWILLNIENSAQQGTVNHTFPKELSWNVLHNVKHALEEKVCKNCTFCLTRVGPGSNL